jgi:hypothetical protein
VAVILSLPVLLPYLRTQQVEGFGRTLAETSRHSAALQSYTQVPPVNLLYGRTGWLAPRAPAPGGADRRHVEHQMFPGFVLVALALVGLARHARSDSRPLAVGFGVLAAAGALLSFGPEGARWMYAALHDNVFGFQAIRAPARFSVLVVAGLAGLAALAIRQMPATWLRAAVLAALCLEYVNAPLPLAAAPAMSTPSGAWLAREPQPGAVLYLPIGVDIENTPYMVQSLEHGRDIVNGYSGQRPAYYTSLVESLADLPSPAAFALLREIDVRFGCRQSAVAARRARARRRRPGL